MVLKPDESFDELVADGNGACPGCGGTLRRWGRARWRPVRGLEGQPGLRPARVRCGGCRVTQVVLPCDVLVRRRDATVVIGRAWAAFASGAGARRVSAMVGVPMETARGWLRRLRAIVMARYGEQVTATAEALRRALASEVAQAAGAGWTGTADVWRYAAHRTQGRLLAANTS